MDTLHKQISVARRQLILQRFLACMCWSCFAALTVAMFAVFANWYWQWGASPWAVLGIAAGTGVAVGATWAVITRASQIEAAIELDKRFGLKERVSSALALEEQDQESDAGRAVADDAVRRVKNLRISERFKLSFNRWSALPLAPTLAIVLLAFLLPDITAGDADAETELSPDQKAMLYRDLDEMQKALEEKIERTKQNSKLEEAGELFKKLEQDRRALDKDTPNAKNTLVKLNNMAQSIKDRQKALEAAEDLKKQLQDLQSLNEGPAEQLVNAMKEGDFDRAQDQLRKLAEKLKNGELNESDMQELQEQISKMQEQIDQAIQKQQQKMQQVQQQLDQAKKSGDQAEVQRLQKQLSQMQSQAQQQQMMQKLSDQLGECAQCMSNGQGQKAAEALSEMAGELGQMDYDPEELGMLSEMSDQLKEMRDSLGMGMGMSQSNRRGEGNGGGDGAGEGDRPEEEDSVGFHDEQASTKAENAAGIVVGNVQGPNRKGIVRESIKEQMESASSESSDALTNQKLDRATREHVRDYMNRVRQGNNGG